MNKKMMDNKINLNWEMKTGTTCYSCKSKISDPIFSFPMKQDMENLTLCLSCEREEKLDVVIKNKKSTINKVKRFLLSKKGDRIIMFNYIGILIFGFSLNIFLMLMGIKNTFISLYTSNILNVSYIYLLYYKTKLTRGDDKLILKNNV
jgi:hypothetical protein